MALLTVQGLTKTFNGFTAIKDVAFEVAEGEILGLIGPNGSGKSTTFNCIAGMYVPTAGSIIFDGREISSTAARSRGFPRTGSATPALGAPTRSRAPFGI